MPIKLNGATSGSVELDVPAAVGSDLQLTLPATAGTALVAPGSTSITVPSVNGTLDRLERPGNILQVVQVTNSTDTRITTSGIDFITTNITPTSVTSKVFIIGNLAACCRRELDSSEGYFTLKKNGTQWFIFDGITPWNNTNNYRSVGSISFNYLDSPGVTTQISYAMHLDMTSGSIDVNNEGGMSSLTLMEIAA